MIAQSRIERRHSLILYHPREPKCGTGLMRHPTGGASAAPPGRSVCVSAQNQFVKCHRSWGRVAASGCMRVLGRNPESGVSVDYLRLDSDLRTFFRLPTSSLQPYSGASNLPIRFWWKEVAPGEKQADEREYYEYNLMDMSLARGQSTHKVRQPEQRIIPQCEPSPSFTASVWDQGDHHTKATHSHRGHANCS